MTLTVEIVRDASGELLSSLNVLLPQLSDSAPPLSMSDLERLVASDSSTLFVAREGDLVVGSLTLVVFSLPSGPRAWIEDVVVDSRFRGRGAGERLTATAIEEARRRGVRTLDLTTRPSRDAANRLYQRMGFVRRETNVYRFFIESL